MYARIKSVSYTHLDVYKRQLELCYIQSGTGKHRIGDTIYEVKEGDLLVINEGVYHQSLAGEHKTPVAEFYVGLTDLNLAGLGRNHFPLLGNCPVFRTEGELQRKLSKLCMAMEAEQELCRIGRYYMMKTYAMQMLLLLLREEEETGKPQKAGCLLYTSRSLGIATSISP